MSADDTFVQLFNSSQWISDLEKDPQKAYETVLKLSQDVDQKEQEKVYKSPKNSKRVDYKQGWELIKPYLKQNSNTFIIASTLIGSSVYLSFKAYQWIQMIKQNGLNVMLKNMFQKTILECNYNFVQRKLYLTLLLNEQFLSNEDYRKFLVNNANEIFQKPTKNVCENMFLFEFFKILPKILVKINSKQKYPGYNIDKTTQNQLDTNTELFQSQSKSPSPSSHSSSSSPSTSSPISSRKPSPKLSPKKSPRLVKASPIVKKETKSSPTKKVSWKRPTEEYKTFDKKQPVTKANPPSFDRGNFLEQIRQGIKLNPPKNFGSNESGEESGEKRDEVKDDDKSGNDMDDNYSSSSQLLTIPQAPPVPEAPTIPQAPPIPESPTAGN